jgi:hypothetical protein
VRLRCERPQHQGRIAALVLQVEARWQHRTVELFDTQDMGMAMRNNVTNRRVSTWTRLAGPVDWHSVFHTHLLDQEASQ